MPMSFQTDLVPCGDCSCASVYCPTFPLKHFPLSTKWFWTKVQGGLTPTCLPQVFSQVSYYTVITVLMIRQYITVQIGLSISAYQCLCVIKTASGIMFLPPRNTWNTNICISSMSHTYTSICAHTHIYTITYIYTHKHTQAHTHTCVCILLYLDHAPPFPWML